MTHDRWATLRYFQRGFCYLCGRKLERFKRGRHTPAATSVDHILPARLGGMKRKGNVALAHHRCNGEKGGRRPFPCEVLFGQIMADLMMRR